MHYNVITDSILHLKQSDSFALPITYNSYKKFHFEFSSYKTLWPGAASAV